MEKSKLANQNVEFLASCELFASLDQEVLQKTANKVKRFSLPAGEYLFCQGDTKDSGLYIVFDGELNVLIHGDDGRTNVVGVIGPGEIVGEVQLLTGQERLADVQAGKPSHILFLPKDDFDKVVAEQPEILNLIGQVIRNRLRRNQLFQILPDYFGELNLKQMEVIESNIEWVHLKNGERLVQFQDPSEDFFIVINGKLQARIPDREGNEQPVGDMFAGENIGELGFFTGEPRAASVYALRDTALVRFTKEGFHALQSELPQTTFQFSKQVIGRLRKTTLGKTFQTSLFVALVPLSQNIPLPELASQLSAAVSGYSHCVHLSSEIVDSEFHQEGISQTPPNHLNEIRLVTWLDDQEKIYPVIGIYETDSSPTNWSKRCIQRADRVIFVGRADTELDFEFLKTMMPSFDDHTIHKELILLYDKPETEPIRTDRWLNQINGIRRHYHLRMQNNRDFRRVARLLSGKAIGLVLGGGGARGFAHIGVLRAIEEAGFEIDLIGGNSIGAIVGAAYALGMDWQTIYEMGKKWGNKKNIIDYTFPALSIISGKSISTLLKKHFGEKLIEDTWIEFFCVSANLTKACQVIHQRGLIWKYIRASSSLPMIIPPVTEKGELLVDGVLVNNLPLEVMKKVNADCEIIGVDVSSEFSLEEYNLPTALSGWRVLWSRLIPRKTAISYPKIMQLFMRINEFSSVRQKHHQYEITDYIIHPDVEEYGVLQFDDFEEIVKRGYQAGKQALAEWQGKL